MGYSSSTYGWDRVFLRFQKLHHVFDWCVALTPRDVGSLVLLPVLDVQVGNAVVVFVDERDGIIAAGSEMANIEVDPDILRHFERGR